jgi:AraC-like DNA-binding protein
MPVFTIISAAGIAIAVFTILLIGTRGSTRIPDKLLMAWLSALALHQLYFVLVGLETDFLPPIVQLLGISLVLMHSSLLYLFSKYAFSDSISRQELWHILPFAIFMISFSFLLYGSPDTVVFRNGFMAFREVLFPFSFYGLYLALVAGGYTLLAWLSIRKHQKYLDQTQSSEFRNVLKWLQRWIIAALLFFGFTYLVIEVSVSGPQIDTRFTFQIVSVFISMYIFYVSFWGIRKTGAFHHFNPQEWKLDKPQSNPADPEAVEELIIKLKHTIESQQLFLDPDLSLSELAKTMNVSPGKISWTINQRLGKNFYDFINEYRVNEFLHRMEQNRYGHLSILGLAFDCGFRSKSTFNAFFKRQTGQTPLAFKKKLEKKSG